MSDFGHRLQAVLHRGEEKAHSVGVGASVAFASRLEDVRQVDGNDCPVPVEEGAVAGASDAGEDGRDEGDLPQCGRQSAEFVVLNVLRIADDAERQIDDCSAILGSL